ncbi:MAG: hypothetical protein MUE40_11695 [Anaerolineae bacterium]|nr:hypothetical protein [Anaerolineae bacterium]
MTANTIIQLAGGVTRQNLHHGQVIVYTFSDSQRETIDAYMADELALLKAQPPGEKLYLMHDMGHPRAVLTPYLRARLEEIPAVVQAASLSGYSATILPDTIMNRILALFVTSFGRRTGMVQGLFTRREEALRWLEDKWSSSAAARR